MEFNQCSITVRVSHVPSALAVFALPPFRCTACPSAKGCGSFTVLVSLAAGTVGQSLALTSSLSLPFPDEGIEETTPPVTVSGPAENTKKSRGSHAR